MIALILSLFTLVVSVTPIAQKPTSPFFDIDPDVVYVTNAISYIKRHQIAYTDHPGTPYILTLAASYTPLRFYAKYVAHKPFVNWSLENITFLFTYSRFFTAVIFSLGIFIFLNSIKRHSNSTPLTLLTWLLLLTYTNFFRTAIRINPENFLPLVYAIWFSLVLSLTQKNQRSTLILVNFISGVALAVKFTNLAFPIVSVLISLCFFTKLKLKNYRQLLINLLVIPFGFVVSTWVVRGQYLRLVSWTTGLATHAGIHGSGDQTLFSLITHQSSIQKLISAEPMAIKLFALTPLIFLLAFYKFKKPEKIIFSILFTTTAVTGLVFSKYDHFYYQLPHLFIFISLLIISLSKFSNLKLFFLLPIIVLSLSVSQKVSDHLDLSQGLKKLAALEEQIKNNPPKHKTLWEFGPTKDFAAIWGRSWSGEFYGQELDQAYPYLGEMIGFKYYRSNKPEKRPLFNACWDQLYIQTATLPKLLENFPDKELETHPLIYPELTLVTSDHCSKIK